MKRITPDDYDFSRDEWEQMIFQHIFDEDDRYMLRRNLLDGIRYTPLAEEVNLSVDQMKKRLKKAKTKIYKIADKIRPS
jgi:DNA-directed RNA polymerase specialized sigma24 family protein